MVGGAAPKLAVVTESRFVQVVRAGQAPTGTVPTVLAYRTLHQPLDLILRGGAIGVFSGSLARLLDDAQALRPTFFAGMPSLWNALHQQFREELQRLEQHKHAQATEKQALQDEEELCEVWRRRKLLGNRVKTLMSSGAPLPPSTSRWLSAAFGVPVVDGYGCTECGGLLNNGEVRGDTTVRLLDRPDIGYTTADRPYPRGEVVANSGTMISGYYLNSEDTQRCFVTLDDGKQYFRTGDLGMLRDGVLVIVGRCNSVKKLANGVYVCAKGLETIYQTALCDVVHKLFVYGNAQMASVAAVVVPATPRPESPEELRVCEKRLRERFRQVAVERGLSPWEVPQTVVVDYEPFTQDNGLLNAAGKLHRPSLVQKYAHALAPSLPAHSTTLPAPAVQEQQLRIGNLSAGFCEVVARVLGLFPTDSDDKRVTPDTSIFELGADSLKVAQLSMLQQTRFGRPVPVAVIAKLPVLRDLHSFVFGGGSAHRTLDRQESTLAEHLEAEVEREWAALSSSDSSRAWSASPFGRWWGRKLRFADRCHRLSWRPLAL